MTHRPRPAPGAHRRRARPVRLRRTPFVVAPLVALVLLAGCSATSAGPDGAEGAGPDRDQGVRFATCMRDQGISTFPDPDASGELTIDGVVNGSSLDPSSAAFEAALSACQDLAPEGFTGPETFSREQLDARLEFARCVREHGVADFPDPAPDAPLVDTNHIPSSGTDAGMTILDAAMAACGDIAARAVGDR